MIMNKYGELLNLGFRFDHSATERGYISRKIDYKIVPYIGRFGIGVKVIFPRSDTTQYVNIEYHIFLEGEKGKENYGGTLMNEPLKKLKETKYKSINPFVIVLDDDNILSDNFLKFIHENCMNNEFTWWLNMLDECGTQRFARKCDRLAYVPSSSGKYNIIHRCSTFDPSQMLFRLDTLLCLGGFGNTRFYDFEMMNNFYNNVYDVDRRLHLQGDFTPILPNTDLYMSCFHNGLVTPAMIDKTINDINNNEFSYEDSYLRIHVGENMYTIQVPAKELIPLLEKYKKTVEL